MAKNLLRGRWIIAIVFTALLLCAFSLCRLNHTDRGEWELTAPGLSIIALRDVRLGPVLWVYWRGKLRGRWQARAEPTPYPTATPYPTSTPYPTPAPKMPLQGA